MNSRSWRKIAIVGLSHRLRWRGRVEINRNIECLSGLPEGRETGMVEKCAPSSAVDHNAGEPQLAYATLELARGAVGILQVDRRKRRKPCRVRLNCGRQSVVYLPRQRRRCSRVETIHIAPGEREHLHVDAAGIHIGQASRSEVHQLFADAADVLIREVTLTMAIHGSKKGRRGYMFLECDGPHGMVSPLPHCMAGAWLTIPELQRVLTRPCYLVGSVGDFQFSKGQ